jgi:hypothetical protein
MHQIVGCHEAQKKSEAFGTTLTVETDALELRRG